MKILLLEDDFVLNELIKNFLLNSYSVDAVYTSKDALDKIYKNKYDIFIFDINLPDISGINLLSEIRGFCNKTPTIFISAYCDIETMKEAFKKGASDYLKKPFELEELKLRIENISKINHTTSSVQILPDVKFYALKHILIVANHEHRLTKKESEILSFLLKNKSQVVSFNEIYTDVWGYDVPTSDATLRTYIKNLRKILGKDSIKTIYKYGYVFE